jgi:hypothetical protein
VARCDARELVDEGDDRTSKSPEITTQRGQLAGQLLDGAVRDGPSSGLGSRQSGGMSRRQTDRQPEGGERGRRDPVLLAVLPPDPLRPEPAAADVPSERRDAEVDGGGRLGQRQGSL